MNFLSNSAGQKITEYRSKNALISRHEVAVQ